jgi:hypothetical protein
MLQHPSLGKLSLLHIIYFHSIADNFHYAHRIKQVSRIIVAEIANAGCDLSSRIFALPSIKLVYTPQCLAMVKCARAVVSAEIDDSAAEALEEAAFQPNDPGKLKPKDKGREGYFVHRSCRLSLECTTLHALAHSDLHGHVRHELSHQNLSYIFVYIALFQQLLLS